MIPDLTSGQLLASHYQLDRVLTSSDVAELWVATHTQTGERVCARIFNDEIDATWFDSISSRIQSNRGLVHPHISLAIGAHRDGDIRFVIEPWLRDASEINLYAEHALEHLQALIETLQYSHSVNLCHGHLSPSNLLIDAQDNLIVTGFGMPAAPGTQTGYISPQLLDSTGNVDLAAKPDTTDDVYALGCMIFECISGQRWQNEHESISAANLAKPIKPELVKILEPMLSHSSFNRNIDLATLADVLDRVAQRNQSGIAAVSFAKSGAATTTTASPLEFTPAGSSNGVTEPQPDRIATRQNKGLPMPLVLSAGAIIIVLAGLLFFLLPEAGNSGKNTSAVASAQNPTLNSTNAPTANTAALEPPSGPTPVELARLELQEEQSKALAKEIIRQQVALEDRGVNLWAGDEYAAINNTLDIADDEYRAGAFDKAQGAYQNVKDNLEELSERMPAVLDAQIDAGEAALASGEPESALAAFTIANLLAPDREDLKLNLARAENMEMVLRLTDQAAVLERSQDLAGALALTEEALTLDNQWQPARDARQRLSQAIKQQKFRAAMSRGFRGIAERDYTAARLGFRDAKSILPDSGEPGDGLAQVEQAEKNEQIQSFRAEAEQALAAEKWDAAIAVYDKALAVTPTLAFAKDGIAQAKARQALDARLQLFLGDPTELQTDQGLSDAAATLREVTRLPQRSDKLNEQLKTLSLLISNARTQIPISLRSDGQTEVTVRKHAALGRFEAETVYLIPGRYTIVGVRDGYRDVREDIVILPGQSIPAVTIASTEKVRR